MNRWSFLRAAKQDGPASGATAPTAVASAPDADWRVRTVVQEHERITDLKLWGFRTAGACSASPEVLKTVIGWLYHNKLTVDGAHAESEKQRLADLSERIVALEGELVKARHHSGEIEQTLGQERAKLEAKRAELIAVRAGDSRVVDAQGLSDRLSFFIASGILVLLTVYLFLFYVSAIYNAFLFDAAMAAEEGLRTGRELSVTIFNGAAFQKAWSTGLMTFVFLGSAPSIVIGLGFLIHHFSRHRQRLAIVAVFAVTFLFDFLLAYEIVNQIHRIKVLTGETQVEFSLGVLLKTPEFYIILLAGFVVYIIWGLILQVVLEGIEKFRPARVAARTLGHAISTLEGDVSRIEEELRQAARETVRLESDLKVLESKRSPRELRNVEFKRHLEELMQGWLTYIAQAFPDERDAREAEAQKVRAEALALLTQ